MTQKNDTIPRRAPQSGQKPESLVIFLHGYGSNGDDLISLVPYWQSLLPSTQFSSPNAPEALDGFAGAYQWFAIHDLDPVNLAQGAGYATAGLRAFIEAEMARFGVTAAQTALVGFSQGTMMALQVGLSSASQFAGILGYSGALVSGLSATGTKPPVLLVHGEQDDRVPLAASQAAQQMLSAAGFDARLHISPNTAHSIAMDGLQVGGAFLAKVLASSN